MFKKEDWSIPALFAEAVGLILELLYIGLQIFYGITYHITVYTLVLNLAVSVLVYAFLTLWSFYPEQINRLPDDVCVGRVRLLSLRMVRAEKLIFVAGLMIPCIADVMGGMLHSIYNVGVMVILLVVAVVYEMKIIQLLRKRDKE